MVPDFNSMSEADQIAALEASESGYYMFQSPAKSYLFGMEVPSSDCVCIFSQIQYPSEAVKLAALNKNAQLLDKIDSPSDEMKRIAQEKMPNVILYLSHPPIDMVIDYVRNNGFNSDFYFNKWYKLYGEMMIDSVYEYISSSWSVAILEMTRQNRIKMYMRIKFMLS